AAAVDAFNAEKRTQATTDQAAERLNAVSPFYERAWRGELLESGGFAFVKTVRGVETRVELSADHLNGHDGQRVARAAEFFTEFFGGIGTLLVEEGKDIPIYGPYDLYKKIIYLAKKGLTIQR